MKEANEDNSMPFDRGDRPEGAPLESRPAHSDIHARPSLAVRGRTEDPTANDCESGLLLRRTDSTAGTASNAETNSSADSTEPQPGAPVRVTWEFWRIAQSEFRYRPTGEVDLGNLDALGRDY